MRTSLKILIPTLATSVLLSACASGSSSGNSASSSLSGGSQSGGGALVRTASNSTLGAVVLVDTQGLTLYHLSGEQRGRFLCASPTCVQAWHPLAAPVGGQPTGVQALGTVKRPDGTEQVTFQGMPLYTFAQDHAPGDAHGQGIKDVGTWSAVTESRPATSPPATTSTSAPARGYGY